jgi:hypothetical protein
MLMIKQSFLQIIFILIICLVLSACEQNAGTVEIEIVETAAEITETTTQTIKMNNCGGKADISQTAEKSKEVYIEAGVGGGVDSLVIKGNLETKYGHVSSAKTNMELVAPPGTNMIFTLEWVEKTWVGVITTQDLTSTTDYKIRVPISLELISSLDLGCSIAMPSSTNTPSIDSLILPTKTTTKVIISEAGGYSFMAPEVYEYEVLGEFVSLTAPDADPDLGPNFFFSGGPFEEGESVDAILESFLADVVGEEGEATEPEAITVGGLEGFTVEFSSEEETGTLIGLVVVVGDETRGFVAFGGGPAETWETNVKPMFMALLETVELFEQ